MGLHHPIRPISGPPGLDPPTTPSERPLAEAVEVYHRTYTTLLRSSGETRLRVLEASHRAMGSSLHPLAASSELDLGAFLYACRRLPDAIAHTELVVMGQSLEVFARQGFALGTAAADPPEAASGESARGAVGGQHWLAVAAPGRRRRWYHDGAGTLAVLMASASDVDDLVPTMVAFQIEWNKLRVRLRGAGVGRGTPPPSAAECAATLGGSADDWEQLAVVWGPALAARLELIATHALSLRVRMLGGSLVGYARGTRRWWQPVLDLLRREDLGNRPVHFVSSNSHSVVNLVTGTVAARTDQIIAHIEARGPEELRAELRGFREGRAQGEWHNLLYYGARSYFREHPPEQTARNQEERARGIFRVASSTALDVAAQVIVLDRLDVDHLDPRLLPAGNAALRAGPAIVINIDYPLGLAAYNILREVAETVGDLRSVYVLGKAATLNADVGDVMLSSVVHDEHSGSTFFLDNAFSVDDIAPYLRFGSGLDNQRTVTVRGTFLQNRGHLDFYYREAFTVVEMEVGPYCQAVFEIATGDRYPVGEPVNFNDLPVEMGIIHYASDTPFTQARTLGARGLSYHGMDSTYAASVAILRRILGTEGVLPAERPRAMS
ncbi:MAG TPA: hypothetical protein VI316_03500 [Candidatus Dormibacteraeota bacterium]